MDEKIEAQDVLRETVQKVTSTKRALGNSEYDSHERIDGMMRYIQDFLGDSMDVEPQASSFCFVRVQGVLIHLITCIAVLCRHA